MRQIDIGKATDGYQNYIKRVPKHERQWHHPRTPDPKYKMPNKHWKAAINQWRAALHKFDLNDGNGHSNGNASAKADQQNNDNENGNKNIKASSQSSAVQQPVSHSKPKQTFSCEKCAKHCDTFEEWQQHRQQCDGIKMEEKTKESDSDDDFDLFEFDIDKQIKSERVSPKTKPNLNIDNDKVSGEQIEENRQDSKEAKLLQSLNAILDCDDDVDDEDDDIF